MSKWNTDHMTPFGRWIAARNRPTQLLVMAAVLPVYVLGGIAHGAGSGVREAVGQWCDELREIAP